MTSRLLKLCSMIVVLALLIQLLPMQILGAELSELLESTAAEEITTEGSAAETAEVLTELTERRTEYTKEFKLSNGLSMAVVYPQAVHYEENGQWKEIDNTLISAGNSLKSGYTNTAGPWQVNFPRAMSGSNAVSITKDGYTLQFYMSGQLLASGSAELMTASAESNTFSIDAVQASQAEVVPMDLSKELASAEHPEAAADKVRSRVQYTNVFENTDVIYDLISNQVKESIVISEYDAAVYGYRYTLNTGAMIPALNEDGSIDLLAPDGKEVVMTMPAPYMIDSSGAVCEDVDVTLEPSGSAYILTYRLPMDWMAQDERAWPVVLDPVVVANSDALNIQDQYVTEEYLPDYKIGALMCGYYPDFGIMRTFIQYTALPKLASADVIVDASLSLMYRGGTSGTTTIEAHKVKGTWESATITWDNQPDHNTIVEDYVQVSGSDRYTWDITDAVREWYSD